MVIPVDEESFNLITKSSKNIIEFVNGLKEDDKLISAVKSIPNMDSYLDGGEVAPILIAMSAQDIVSCLDALFGDVKLTTTGGIGLYTFFSQLNNNESSYLSYIHLALGGVEDEISDKISLFRNWGLNATTDEFKLAILLSNVNNNYLKKYWELICQFGYYVVKAENKILNETISEHQQNYLNNIQLRAQKYFEDSAIDFMSDCKKGSSESNGEDLSPAIPFVSFKKEGEFYTYTILRDKIIDYTIESINSKGTKLAELQAKILRRTGGLDIEILYIYPKHYLGEHLISGKKNVVEGETLCVLKCKYTGENHSLKEIDYPLIKINTPSTGQFILDDFDIMGSYNMTGNIKFQIKSNSDKDTVCYDKFFNIYDYCKISSDIFKKTEPYSDSLNVILQWNYRNGCFVRKDDILGCIKIESLEIESNFVALSDGYFSINTKSFCDHVNKWNFLVPSEDDFSQECLLYSIYPSKENWIEENCDIFNIIENKDIFNDQTNLKWEVVANRYIDAYKIQGYPSFEMASNKGISIYISFEYLDKKAYIAFGIKSANIQLRIGDVFSLLLKKEKNKKVLDFSILNKPTQVDSSDIKEYDKVFYFELFYEDIDILKSYLCTNWRITFADNRRTSIDGVNESDWTPSFLAGDVFRNYACSFDTELNEREIEIEHHKTTKLLKGKDVSLGDSCHVYLMHDTTNGFYKIGISNNPEYRERTLQSEKPSIEIVCCKEYPIRSIAEAFEAALHKAFASKRIRGEWFSLDETDVMVLVKTLS